MLSSHKEPAVGKQLPWRLGESLKRPTAVEELMNGRPHSTLAEVMTS